MIKVLSAAIIALATLATPAMARESHVAARHLEASIAPYVDGRACVRARAVGAFATQPWNNAPPCEPSTIY